MDYANPQPTATTNLFKIPQGHVRHGDYRGQFNRNDSGNELHTPNGLSTTLRHTLNGGTFTFNTDGTVVSGKHGLEIY